MSRMIRPIHFCAYITWKTYGVEMDNCISYHNVEWKQTKERKKENPEKWYHLATGIVIRVGPCYFLDKLKCMASPSQYNGGLAETDSYTHRPVISCLNKPISIINEWSVAQGNQTICLSCHWHAWWSKKLGMCWTLFVPRSHYLIIFCNIYSDQICHLYPCQKITKNPIAIMYILLYIIHNVCVFFYLYLNVY